jgi:hypothetical protein
MIEVKIERNDIPPKPIVSSMEAENVEDCDSIYDRESEREKLYSLQDSAWYG